MNVKVNLKIKQYAKKSEDKLDGALAYMAMELETLAKNLVPKDTGALASSGKHLRKAVGKYQVWFNKEYAGAMERGLVKTPAGWRPVRNYTTPGTTKGYLSKSRDFVDSHKDKIIKAFLK